MALRVVTTPTSPFDGQKPGTSGLRKATKVFLQDNYTENFVQATLNALGDRLEGSSLVIGGDGRYYCKEATLKIVKMCAGNRVGLCWRILTQWLHVYAIDQFHC